MRIFGYARLLSHLIRKCLAQKLVTQWLGNWLTIGVIVSSVLMAASSVLTRLVVKPFLNGLLIGDKGEIIMVNHPDSSATTQSTWNYLNNIPSRTFAWLCGKLVRIATAVKNFLSGGSSSETQPVSIPVVERTISKTCDDHTQHDSYLRVPASLKTTPPVSHEATPTVSDASLPPPHWELELYNRANRRLPYFTGAELQRVSCGDVKSVLSDIHNLFSRLQKLNKSELKLPGYIYGLVVRKALDDLNLPILASKVRGLDIESWSGKSLLEKIRLLLNISRQNAELAGERLKKVKYYRKRFEKMLLPRYYYFSVALTSKYQKNSTQPATEQEIRGLQIGVEGIEAVLTDFTDGQIGDQIVQDASLQLQLSGIKEKLQGLTRLLQIR